MRTSVKDKSKAGKSRWRFIRALIVAFMISFFSVGAAFYALIVLTPINLAKLTTTPEPTVVYDRTGMVYMKIGQTPMALKDTQIPVNLQNAIVATEDHTFWNGSSIDVRSILRALLVDISTAGATQGASTIEEQLAKIVYLNDNKTISYKMNQMLLGVKIDRYFTKQQILTMYLNKVFLGENTVGVDEAAMRYFGVNLNKDPGALTLDEAALLAGLPQAPTAYDPLVHPDAALTRRNEVLQNMVKYGYLSQAQASVAERQPLGAKYHSIPSESWDTHPLFANVLFDAAARHGITAAQLLHGGLKVYTTIDPKVQRAVHEVFWSGQYNSDFPGLVEGAAVLLDPKTGGIIGVAGTRKNGYVRFGLDRIYSVSSPGSSIKPIMEYAPAIQSGKWTPTSILDNQPQNFGGGYTPQNWEGPNGPAKVTLQYGLEWSQNIASVWLLQHIGLQTGVKFALKDGILLTKKDKQQLGIAIGGMQYGVDPLEMAQAYEAFDNNGVQMKAHLINKIVNQDGQVTYQSKPSSTVVMTPQTATTMTSLMQDVVDYGTGTSAQVSGWGVAGKTGTVQYSAGLNSSVPNWVRDAWFDGYTPNIVGSIHIGYDVSSPAHHMTMYPLDPSANAAKIFGQMIRLAEQGNTPQQFPVGPLPAAQGTPYAAYTIVGGSGGVASGGTSGVSPASPALNGNRPPTPPGGNKSPGPGGHRPPHSLPIGKKGKGQGR